MSVSWNAAICLDVIVDDRRGCVVLSHTVHLVCFVRGGLTDMSCPVVD